MTKEKINFNVSADLKRNIERLASYHGKTLTAFMLDVCNFIVKANNAKITEQAAREKEPINFGGNFSGNKKNKNKNKKKSGKAQGNSELKTNSADSVSVSDNIPETSTDS